MSSVAQSAQTTYVRLRVAQHLLAIAAGRVEEFADYRVPVPLPSAPAHLLGLMPLRDRSVPLVALDIFLATAVCCEPRRVVIVVCDGMRVGIVCDEIVGMRDIPNEQLTPLPRSMPNGIHPYVTHEHATDSGVVRVLDVSALLAAARVRKP
ncbi:MAG: chemotaxis protein CheW [Myxococcota bacterium]|nr:chemotaxis protein CheW [Myxococcota bacterium]